MPADQTATLLFSFTAFFAAVYAALLRRADLWKPFTPTLTSVPGKWVGLSDSIRWMLSFLFLLLIPAVYFTYTQLFIRDQAAIFSVGRFPPKFIDLWRIFVVVTLAAPPVGFYCIWQAIVRSAPKFFYSDLAIEAITKEYKNAFDFGHGATIAWGLTWIFLPMLLVYTLTW
jgi:hypothetical protein